MNIFVNANGMHEADVDGQAYEFEKWGAQDATETLLDLIAVVGKPLGLLAAASGGDLKGLLKADVQDLDPIFEHLTGALVTHRAMVMRLITRLGTHRLLCDGVQVRSFDQHYKDKLPHLLRVARVNMEVQYGSFFADVRGQQRRSAPKDEPNQTPSTTTPTE